MSHAFFCVRATVENVMSYACQQLLMRARAACVL
jgi:hypothetical protein